MYLKLADMPILDTINKQKTEVILAKYGIHNKQEFIELLKILEDVKHNYNIFQRELESTSLIIWREFRLKCISFSA